jgi:transaldolase
MSASAPSLQTEWSRTLTVKLFIDSANSGIMRALSRNDAIVGFTTNPTLMRRAGVVDYKAFALEVLAAVGDRPVSFAVCADDLSEMNRQAHRIASWGGNVYVKVPITNSRGESTAAVIGDLTRDGIKVNVTAVMTLEQVEVACQALGLLTAGLVSLFVGRIADTGRNPVPMVLDAVRIVEQRPDTELLWASPREVLNVFQANDAGCHIIAITSDMLAKLALAGKDLEEYSIETVEMFHNDARIAGYVP